MKKLISISISLLLASMLFISCGRLDKSVYEGEWIATSCSEYGKGKGSLKKLIEKGGLILTVDTENSRFKISQNGKTLISGTMKPTQITVSQKAYKVSFYLSNGEKTKGTAFVGDSTGFYDQLDFKYVYDKDYYFEHTGNYDKIIIFKKVRN